MAVLTDRQQQIKDRLDASMSVSAVADDLGITRNAVYQQIQRMRRNGALPEDYTPTGQPVRETRHIHVPLGNGGTRSQAPGQEPLATVPRDDYRRACLEVLQELQDMQVQMNQLVIGLARLLAGSDVE